MWTSIMSRKPFPAVFFLPVSGVSVHCVYSQYSTVYSSHITTAVDKTNSARMLGTTGDCSVVHRLMPIRWPQEASCMYKYALGPALYALLTEAVSYYCDRYDSRKEYE